MMAIRIAALSRKYESGQHGSLEEFCVSQVNQFQDFKIESQKPARRHAPLGRQEAVRSDDSQDSSWAQLPGHRDQESLIQIDAAAEAESRCQGLCTPRAHDLGTHVRRIGDNDVHRLEGWSIVKQTAVGEGVEEIRVQQFGAAFTEIRSP